MFGGNFAPAGFALNDNFARRCDLRLADNAFDLVLSEQKLDTPGELADDLVLVRHHGRKIEARRAGDAEAGKVVTRQFVEVARMKQGFGGNAADVQAGAAEGAAAVDASRRKTRISSVVMSK